MAQWLGLCSFTAEGPSSVHGWGTKILQAKNKKQGKNIKIKKEKKKHWD